MKHDGVCVGGDPDVLSAPTSAACATELAILPLPFLPRGLRARCCLALLPGGERRLPETSSSREGKGREELGRWAALGTRQTDSGRPEGVEGGSSS